MNIPDILPSTTIRIVCFLREGSRSRGVDYGMEGAWVQKAEKYSSGAYSRKSSISSSRLCLESSWIDRRKMLLLIGTVYARRIK